MKNPEQSLRGKLNGDDYVHERTGWIKAQRLMTELKLEQERRETVNVDLVMQILCAVAAATKQAVLSVPAAVAPAVAPHAAAEAEATIYRALYEAFDGLSEDKLARIIDQACTAAAAGAKAAAAPHRKPMGGSGKAAKPGVKRKSGAVEN